MDYHNYFLAHLQLLENPLAIMLHIILFSAHYTAL